MSRRKRKTVIIILSILVAGLSIGFLLIARRMRMHFGDGRARLVITEHSLGAVDPDYAPYAAVVSEDFTTIAYAVERAGKWFVVVDGEEGRAYNAIWWPERHYGGAVIFSGDGRHLAHTAERDGKWFVVVDGEEGRAYNAIWPPETMYEGAVIFSGDGRHLAHTAERDGKWFVVVDGKEGKPFDHVDGDTLTFLSGGPKVAYAAARGEEWFLINDAVETGPYKYVNRVVASSDGKRLAYSFDRGGSMWFICDGKEYGSYDYVYSMELGPDGRHLLCWIEGDGRNFALIDGAPVETLADTTIWWPRFAPNGRDIYYVCSRGDNASLVLDGKEWPAFGDIGDVHFSPDGLRAAYVARGERSFASSCGNLLELVRSWSLIGWSADFLVVDGTRGRDYVRILGPIFSPDSRHVGYIAWRDDRWFAVVDGVETLLEMDCTGFQWSQWWVSADGTVLRLLSDTPPEFILYEIRLVPQ